MWSEELLEQFVILASQELSGDWVLCGASVLPLLGINTRTTWDIDLYGMNDQSQSEIMKLMDLVGSLGVPAECINVSGGYYLSKIPNFSEHLVLLQESQAKIYRPDFYLFSQLKLKRFSEVDLLDCQELFKKEAATNPQLINLTRELLVNELSKISHPEKAKRVVQFMQYLNN